MCLTSLKCAPARSQLSQSTNKPRQDEAVEQFDGDEEMLSEGSSLGSDLDDEDLDHDDSFSEDDEGDGELHLDADDVEEVLVDAGEPVPEGEEWVDEDEDALFPDEDMPADDVERRLNQLAENLRGDPDAGSDDEDQFSDEGDRNLEGELEFDEGYDLADEPVEPRINRSIWDVLDAQVDEGLGRPLGTYSL